MESTHKGGKTTNDDTISIKVQWERAEAEAIAEFLKRAGHSDYRRLACNDDEAFVMLYAADKLRDALAAAGIAPR